MKILLPVQLNPVSRRKDRSIKLSFETRELNHSEILTLMALESSEMWMLLSTNPNQLQEEDIPSEDSDIKQKTPSQRLRNVLFVLYQQAIEKGTFVGEFQAYYNESMERLIQQLKDKIDD